MCDKFFEDVGVSDDLLFAGGGCVNLIHQLGETVEGGFIAHFLLSRFFRHYSKDEDGARALLILNHHSKAHWISIGSKLGINLASLEERGSLIVIDLLKESYQVIKATPKDNDDPMCLQSLYSRCHKAIQAFKQANARRVFVVIENLTTFLHSDRSSFTTSERDVVQLLLNLRALSVAESNTCSITIAGQTQSPQMTGDSLELTRFANTVNNAFSTVTFEVSPLNTGFSAQVTGYLKLICNPKKISSEKKLESAFIRNYHFKLESNGARATAL